MKDHTARKNRFEPGVPAGEAFEQVTAEGGVPATRGVPRESAEYIAAHTQLRGVPMDMPAVMPERIPDAAPRCIATTKKGNPCQAYSVADAAFCVGHNK